MEALDGVNEEVARIFAAKEGRRRDLARLSFPDKVRVLIEQQQMAVTILRARRKTVKPWSVDRPGV
jgi:hypothetical protein